MAIGNELVHEFDHNTCAWEQQEWNKTQKQTKKVSREERVTKKSKAGWKKRSPDSLSQPHQNTIIINLIW